MSEFLKDFCPQCFFNDNLNNYRGKKIAIDLPIVLKKFSAVIHYSMLDNLPNKLGYYNKDEFISKLKDSVLLLAFRFKNDYDITPIFIFDGERRIEKEDCKRDRDLEFQKNKQNVINKYNYIVNNINTVNRKDYEEYLNFRKKYYGIGNILTDTIDNIPDDRENIVIMSNLLFSYGFCVIQAFHDSEDYCASLMIENKVDMVYSTDIDCLAFGVSFLIREVKPNGDISCINLTTILKKICYSFQINDLNDAYLIFVDLCIMSGCDYNNYRNISNYGCKRSFDLLRKHYNIENISNFLDVSSLRHYECRRIFFYKESYFDESYLFFNRELFLSNLYSLPEHLKPKISNLL